MQQITNWSEALLASLAGAVSLFFAAVPRLIGFAIILIVGWVIASLIEKALVTVLHAARFNVLADRAGVADFLQKSNVKGDAAGTLGVIARWFVRLIALVVAFDALGLVAVSDILRQLLMWLPNLVVALVVLGIGGLAANAMAKLVQGAAAGGGVDRPNLLAKVARYAVWAFAVMVAINQLGIATSLINILLTATTGAVALALGLSFGLGARDTAAAVVRKWYESQQASGPQLRQAGDAANQMNILQEYLGPERRTMYVDRRAHGGMAE
ncbi:mechanosensitive ion channel family protein [Massilia sp. S19_KUP03_FR1]|uniref:mechanosensitive ion channel family protein n=1 Tax=Massilia sp. S19_KUP03_FR1 TaxID=3025503 RepID=UPI002FCD6D97